MSAIQVAIPVLKGRTSIVVDKGRPWSVVEHLILEALATEDWTVSDLTKSAKIPRRVVIESIIRLMRAGWVDLLESKGSVVFRANSFGLVAVGKTELPRIFERMRRQLNFTIDLVDGGVFRNREWFVYDEYTLLARDGKETIVWIEPQSDVDTVDRDDFYETLLDYDEELVSADPSGVSRKYVLATVRNGLIEGLPDRELSKLRAAILEAALSIDPNETSKKCTFPVPGVIPASNHEIAPDRLVNFDNSDLVLDGEAHRNTLKRIFETANKQIFIHSTFIDEERFLAWLPEITAAAKRGVRTHVFWGQNEDTTYIVSSRKSISNLAKNCDVQNLGDSLVIYPFSTMSHAKLIVADSGRSGSYVAVVGSCNWLSSGFASYEASVLFRDPLIVRDVVRHFADLSFAHNGIWSDLATELVKISKALQDAPTSTRASARASILVGAQHKHYVLRARDEAASRIFVASHRLGPISTASVITPLMTGAETKKIKAEVFYGRTTGAVWGERENVLVKEAAEAGVSVGLIEAPRLHAKMLAWDDDNIVITSLNWLSAAPGDLNSLKEIGVHIESKGIAKALINHFENARDKQSFPHDGTAE